MSRPAARTHAFVTPWKTLAGSVAKGSHVIQLCFESESQGATVQFDAVQVGTASVPSRPLAWSAIKVRY